MSGGDSSPVDPQALVAYSQAGVRIDARRMAQYTGNPLVVRDKDLGTLIFATDGSVLTSEGKVLVEALPSK